MRRTAWLEMMAGEGAFIDRGFVGKWCSEIKKAADEAAFSWTSSTYLAADLPYLLRNLSTRPPMVSTDFCVPV